MATSDPIEVTSDRADLIAGVPLAAGTYSIQNVGGSFVMYAERNAAIADDVNITGAHVLTPLGTADAWAELDVIAGRAFYVWARSGEQSILVVTEAE